MQNTLIITDEMTNGRIRNWLKKHKKDSVLYFKNPDVKICIKGENEYGDLIIDASFTDRNLQDVTVDTLLDEVRKEINGKK